ncbi:MULTISPECIES: protein-tyrosine phosphatase family protein [Acinetobacter]|uniref:protein-tyrosine phosphatase family protein n=1 Tax=Acinetobacter TaxID=469 RepID=UPI0027D30C9B|nr:MULTISPECIES: protein-tyrosine phosphatase family protein [Acinetobacter]
MIKEIQQARKNNEKVLLYCYCGSDRTAASIALYRIILQHWSIEDAGHEIKYGGYGFHMTGHNIEKVFSPEPVKWIRV